MANVITSEPKSVVVAAVPQWGVATRKYAVEAIGAFFLTFVVAVSVLSGSVFTPLAAGATLMVMIYAGGHISGGHFNPAVTLAVLVRGRIGIRDAVAYWIAQVAGGVIAGVIARSVVNPPLVRTLTLAGHTEAAAAVVELLITFALCYVVLNVATSKDQPGNQFFGLAIGSLSRQAPSPSAASPVACSTRRSRSARPPPACSPGRRSGFTWSSSSAPAWRRDWHSGRSTLATGDPARAHRI
jgi:aquaporin Z